MEDNRIVKKRPYTAVTNDVYDKMIYKLGTHAQRLLFTIASNISKDDELFPTMEMDMRTMFEPLGVENDNNKYEIVRDAFVEIAVNPLIDTTKTARRLRILPWFSSLEYDIDKSHIIEFSFSKRQRAILSQLKDNFVKISINQLLKLPTEYATYLYPLIKSKHDRVTPHKNIVIFEITFVRLKQWTHSEDVKSYDVEQNRDANRNFLLGVTGIKKNTKSGKWVYVTNKYKTKNGNVEKPAGALYEISKHTDLKVTARPLKTGRKYDRVEFTVIAKKKTRVTKKPKIIEEGKRVKDGAFLVSALSLEMIKLQYVRVELMSAEIISKYKSMDAKEWRKMNPSVVRISTVGNDWYMCRM